MMEPAGIIDALLRRRKPQPAAEVSPSDDDLRALGCSFVATATWPCDQHSTTALDVNRQIVAKRDLPEGEWEWLPIRGKKFRFRVKAISQKDL